MILIIGNSVDLAESVTREINTISDESIVFFKANLCLEGETLSYISKGKTFSIVANIDGKEIDLSNARSIWFWKPLLPKELRTLEPSTDQLFVYRQFGAMWRSIVSLLSDRLWVNEYYKMMAAEHKPYQLQVAAQLGFFVPDTCITSDPERAREFWQYCGKEMIFKPLMLSPTEDSVLFTNKVTDAFMDQIERLRSSPVIFQRLVPHKHELRITVVGRQIFPAEVISESVLDWRRNRIQVRPYDLPLEMCEFCLKYVDRLGLQYGCIDMIVTPDDQYVFLEINPNGQWGFVEQHSGLPIGKSIAHLLVGR